MSAPTISDVAKSAGVGKTSVSRFLNGETAALSPPLRARIENAIASLNYRPNQMARGLKRGRTRLVGVLLADLQNPFSVALIQGIEAACRECGLMPMICNAGNEVELENRFLDLLRTYRAEGLLVNPVGLPESALRNVVEGDIPVVLMDRKVEGIACDSVGLDNVSASKMLVTHLAASGFQSVAFVSEAWSSISSRRERESAVLAEARLNGMSVSSLVVDREDEQSIARIIDQMRESATRVRTALVAANGQTMLALALELARRRDVGLPGSDAPVAYRGADAPLGRLGLASFDDPDWAAMMTPGITTLRQPTFDIGARALYLLNDRLDTHAQAVREKASGRGNAASSPADTPRNMSFEAELIVRSSTHAAFALAG
ncbi:LacI family DNA-binding transcriptional regulator [Robbsia sp. KACC 23696]|uniref:LacI family DNA-binding transcriptional regulator n=1 Tax=Robbsia sp. KACC 23696 TaxID=3149231 RepID=UPI00325BF0E6